MGPDHVYRVAGWGEDRAVLLDEAAEEVGVTRVVRDVLLEGPLDDHLHPSGTWRKVDRLDRTVVTMPFIPGSRLMIDELPMMHDGPLLTKKK